MLTDEGRRAFDTPTFCLMVRDRLAHLIQTNLSGEMKIEVGYEHDVSIRLTREPMRIMFFNMRTAYDSEAVSDLLLEIEKVALTHGFSLTYRSDNATLLAKLRDMKYTRMPIQNAGVMLKSLDNLKKDWPQLVNEVKA